MIIAGIDPGLTKANPTGWAIYNRPANALIATGVITPPKQMTVWSVRLGWISEALKTVLAQHSGIDAIAYEYPHVAMNVQTAIKLAHVGGVISCLAALEQIPCYAVQPIEAKRDLAGDARADKQAMINAVRQQFGVGVVKDAADAVGIAIAGATKHWEATL